MNSEFLKFNRNYDAPDEPFIRAELINGPAVFNALHAVETYLGAMGENSEAVGVTALGDTVEAPAKSMVESSLESYNPGETIIQSDKVDELATVTPIMQKTEKSLETVPTINPEQDNDQSLQAKVLSSAEQKQKQALADARDATAKAYQAIADAQSTSAVTASASTPANNTYQMDYEMDDQRAA